MSTIIKFDLKELRRLSNDKNSCIIEKRVIQNLALQPWCLGNLKESIRNLLDYKIGKFDKEFNGILLSYKNLCVLQNVGSIRNDNADVNFQVQADYFIFQPYVGATLKGIVNKNYITHLGVLVHRVFNVVILRPTEEPGNKWIGSNIREGLEVTFKIVVLDLFGALPYIRGELDERCVKLEPDGGDDIIETKPTETINLSYANVANTKPCIQKQIGDGQPNTPFKNSPHNRTKLVTPNKNQLKNGSPSTTNNSTQAVSKSNSKFKSKNLENEICSEKIKSKRQVKMDTEETEATPKQPKKHKRDV